MVRKIADVEVRDLLPVIEKAKIACENRSCDVLDHFVEMNEMVCML